MNYADLLLREIESATKWPLNREARIQRMLREYVAIMESDARLLTPYWWYEDEATRHKDYTVDPLGERIPGVWAEMLFGEEPTISPASPRDSARLEAFIDFNDLPSELKRAEEIRSSEGEVWWRLVSMPSFGHVQIEFHSRANVVPLIRGQKVVAVAFVSEIEIPATEGEDVQKEWLYVEVHGDGIIYNRLYYHTKGGGLGQPQDLNSRPETEGLQAEVNHGLPCLAGRLMNKKGRRLDIGISDFKGIDGLLLHLSELQNIGQGNARLTGKQRVVIPQRFLSQFGSFPQGAEVLVATEVDSDPDKIKNEFAQIEWKFDAAALIAWKNDVVDTILTRARVAPPLIGRGTESAQTGPALRARLLDSVLAAQGKGQTWDDLFPGTALELAFRFEALDQSKGGAGVGWIKPEAPDFKRKNALPEDEESRSRRVVMEVNAEILSIQTAIEENNPDWGEDRVQEEIGRLKTERDREPMPPVIAPGIGGGTTSSSDGTQGIPDPAGGIPRKPGEPTPTAVVDPKRPVKA